MADPAGDGALDRTVRVRCHELAPVIGDLEGNLAAVDDAVRDAMAADRQLLVLPELATSGYHLTPDEARAAALTAGDEVFVRWARLLRADAVLVVGFPEAADGVVHNSAAVLTERGVLAVYRKTHLWDTEREVFTAGDVAAGVLDTPVGPLGTLLCYDLEFPEVPRRLALAGAEVLAVPTNWPVVPTPPGEHPPEVIQAMAAARASQVAVACCDRRGEERGERWTQGTTVVGPDGWPRGEKDAEGRLDADVELLADRRAISPRNDVYGDRRPDLYS